MSCHHNKIVVDLVLTETTLCLGCIFRKTEMLFIIHTRGSWIDLLKKSTVV